MSLALTEIPQTIDAGTSVSYTRALADYPATAGWALTLYLAGAGTANALAVAAGDSFVVTLTASATAALPAGAYTYIERVVKGAEAHDVARGTLGVRADVAQATAGSLQSWAERTLVAVEAAIRGELVDANGNPTAIASYQVHGRAVSKIPLKDLLDLRNQLATRIAQQKSGRFSTPIAVRFSPASRGGRR